MGTLRNLLIVLIAGGLGFLAAFKAGQDNYKKDFTANLMKSEYDRISLLAEGTNKLVHLPLATADNNPGMQMSPDVLYSAMSYELNNNPLGLYLPLPNSSWTLSFYDESCNNFYSIDDRLYQADGLQIAVVSSDQEVNTEGNARVIKSPTKTGIIIIRYIIPSHEKTSELVTLRKEIKTGLIDLKNKQS